MSYQGDRAVGSTLTFNFDTIVNGVMTTLSGTPSLSVLKTGSTVPSTAATLTVDYRTQTGINHVVIDTSTDASFFATGDDYSVIISTGTLGGLSMAAVIVGEFSLGLGNMSAVANSLNAASALNKMTNAVARGTVTAGASATLVPTSVFTIGGSTAAAVVSDQFKDGWIFFDADTTSNGLRGVKKAITANSAVNPPTLTVDALPAVPASGDLFSII